MCACSTAEAADQTVASNSGVTLGLSLKPAIIFSERLHLFTVHPSLCSIMMALTSRTRAALLGRMPTLRVRRLISRFKAFEQVSAVALGPMVDMEVHVGQHIVAGVVHQDGELRDAGAQAVGHLAPLPAGCGGGLLVEYSGDRSRDLGARLGADMGEYAAHGVHAVARSGRLEDLGDCGLQTFAVVSGLLGQLLKCISAVGHCVRPVGEWLNSATSSLPNTGATTTFVWRGRALAGYRSTSQLAQVLYYTTGHKPARRLTRHPSFDR